MTIDSIASTNKDGTSSYRAKLSQAKNEVHQIAPATGQVSEINDQVAKSYQETVNARGQTVGTIINTVA